MQTTDYNKQAEDFLTKHGIKFRATLSDTSTSAVWGLFCLPDHAKHRHGCLAQTKELGLIWIADLEDMQLHDLAEQERKVGV